MRSLVKKSGIARALAFALAMLTLTNLSPAFAEDPMLFDNNQASQIIADERTVDYAAMRADLDERAKALADSIQTAQQLNLDVPMAEVKKTQQQAQAHQKAFNDAAAANQADKARNEYRQARSTFALSYGMSMPSRAVEARCIWLDRGTIVGTKDAKGMTDLFNTMEQAHFNVVYFEYNNGGYAMCDSDLLPKYPKLAAGYDPLACALQEARKRGMEFHVWARVFAVGNRGLNPMLGKPGDYPGPVIEKHPDWALRASNGSVFPPQADKETWISPANIPGCEFLKAMILEVSRKDIDGLQLDYIRFPFQKVGTEVGYDKASRAAFEKETGLNLSNLDDQTRKAWQAWKTSKVNKFVQDISLTLKRAKPGLVVSAAVYAFRRELRLSIIQQDWEPWTQNGWIDTLNPMTYDESLDVFVADSKFVKRSVGSGCFVYPSVPYFRIADGVGVIDRIDESRKMGALGTTGFATAQLDVEKIKYLKLGPYRKPAIASPHLQPVRGTQLMFDEFAACIYKCSGGTCKQVLATQEEDSQILTQVEEVRQALLQVNDSSKSQDLDAVMDKVEELQKSVNKWLSLESMVKRSLRVDYLTNSLNDVKSVLTFAIQKAKLREQLTPTTALPDQD
ncbi:MAG: family 10 glycosylhydrolase [Candidatus Obscuribacterales bacterium]|nr:family 10 glycosylhydrolase [Candidatus Obscuribacterales bacterium]